MVDKLNQKSERTEIRLVDDGITVTDNEKVANVFNSFFKSKIETLREKIDPHLRDNPMIMLKKEGKVTSTFKLRKVTPDEVEKKIRLLKNKPSCGPDSITASTLKDGCQILSAPLTAIINASIDSGKFPTPWKTAKVVPILKKGSPEIKTNYRPVSLLSVVAKLLEMVIQEQLSDYFEKNKLLPTGQHGFRKKRSTSSALFSVCGWITTQRQQKKEVAMAAYDLTAAFDSLDAGILDEKLSYYGLDETSRRWIGSFLSNRRQYVVVGNGKSACLDMTVGSPQGSILSPLLFIIYVADIDKWIKDGSTSSYADDVVAMAAGETKEEAVQKLEKTSNELMVFFASNMLVANATKTTLIVCQSSRDKNMSYRMNVCGSIVKESSNVTLLGVKMSSDMTWDEQQDSVISSLRSTNGLLSRLSVFIPNRCLTPLVHGLLLSKIRYALPLFANIRTHDNDPVSAFMQRVQVELNNGLRIVLGKRLTDHVPVADMLSQIGIPSVNQLAVEMTIMETWRQMKNELPAGEYFVGVDSVSERSTRRTGKRYLVPPPADRSGYAKFMDQGTKVWNVCPQEVRDGDDEKTVKTVVKQFARSMPI